MSQPRLEDGARAPLFEHPNFQLGAPLSPSTSEAEVAKAVVAFFPAHRAHLTTMRNLANSSSLLSGHVYVAVLRTPRTIRTRLREIEPGYYEIEWPSTLHGTSLDGGAVIEASKIGRFLIRKFGGLRFTVSGDFQGEHALTGQIVAEMAGSAQVLIPEGVGVFRSLTEAYPWIVKSWRSAIGLIATDTLREMADWLAFTTFMKKHRKWKRRLRPFWRLYRIIILALRKPSTNDLTMASKFQFAVSQWPKDVTRVLGISDSEYLMPAWATSPSDLTQNELPQCRYDGLFIHQSFGLTKIEWAKICEQLKTLNLSSVLVKLDRHEIDSETFLSGLRQSLPELRVDVYSGNLSAQELALQIRVQEVISLTSTALFDLACLQKTSFRLISLSRALWAVLHPQSPVPPDEERGYGFRALFLTGRQDRIVFL